MSAPAGPLGGGGHKANPHKCSRTEGQRGGAPKRRWPLTATLEGAQNEPPLPNSAGQTEAAAAVGGGGGGGGGAVAKGGWSVAVGAGPSPEMQRPAPVRRCAGPKRHEGNEGPVPHGGGGVNVPVVNWAAENLTEAPFCVGHSAGHSHRNAVVRRARGGGAHTTPEGQALCP